MSYSAQAVVISGYKVPRKLWEQGFNYCEEHYKTNPDIPEDWEDMFIDMDVFTGDENETFFGDIIYSITEDTRTREYNTILADSSTVSRVQAAFSAIFSHIYMISGFPIPSYNKYIGMRWL